MSWERNVEYRVTNKETGAGGTSEETGAGETKEKRSAEVTQETS